MNEALDLWEQLQQQQAAFEARQREAFTSVRAEIERVLAEQRERERRAIEEQKARLAELRQRLAEDARPLLHTEKFQGWLQGVLKSSSGERRSSFLPGKVARWELASQPTPVGLHGVERLTCPGYNDEEHYLSSLTVVEARFGDLRFFIGFETARRFALSERERPDLAEQIEYSPYDIDDDVDLDLAPRGDRRRKKQRPTWHQLATREHDEDLAPQIFALARFAVPMLEAAPSQPSFSYP